MAESIERTLGRIEGKLDAWIDTQKEDAARDKEVDDRLDRLENWKTGLASAGSVVVFLFAIAAKFLFDFAARH
jgi:hypothetical protein